jgi:hypothetical protein
MQSCRGFDESKRIHVEASAIGRKVFAVFVETNERKQQVAPSGVEISINLGCSSL